MFIKTFQLVNYKSFYETEEIALTPNFNVIIGENNTGKTALLQALSLQFASNPHKSLKTLPTIQTVLNQESILGLTIKIAPEEMPEIMSATTKILSPDIPGTPHKESIKHTKHIIKSGGEFYCKNTNGQLLVKYANKNLSLDQGRMHYVLRRIDPDSEFEPPTNTPTTENNQPNLRLHVFLEKAIKERVYIFRAERMNISTYGVGTNAILDSSARNLPEVLGLLQSNHSRFNRYNKYVKRIFPNINRVTTRITNNQQNTIYVWQHDFQSEREDLAMPLSECGTGISQVLAILYVILTSEYPKVIIIDEPQSFLHPGATRKLFEILREHPQHQYIISTHSPTALTTLEPKCIIKVSIKDGLSAIEQISADETGSIRELLSEIGVRISDIFGADNILWVEGKTEELCFQKILQRLPEAKLLGTQILGVVHTSDFEGRLSKLTYEVYKRLSQGSNILPPAIGFVFDREGRTPSELQSLEHNSSSSVVFLKRRMYENYILNPKAIVAVINERDQNRPTKLDFGVVEDWLQKNKWNRNFFEKPIPPEMQSDEFWIQNVHAAKLLDSIFNELTEARVCYDKTNHGLSITEWVLENSPDDLSEIKAILERFFKK